MYLVTILLMGDLWRLHFGASAVGHTTMRTVNTYMRNVHENAIFSPLSLSLSPHLFFFRSNDERLCAYNQTRGVDEDK